MGHLLLLLLIPLIIGGAGFLVFRQTITWREFGAQEGICTVLLMLGYFLARCSAMHDTEILNGHITDKVEDTTSCCHCTSVCDSRDKDGTCTRSHTECDHSRDWEWYLETSTGHTIMVETCSGWRSPPRRWTNAQVGEFAAVENGYQNYLLADPDTLLRHGANQALVEKIPPFPREVYDLHRIHKVVTDGPRPPATWQPQLEKLNDDLGASKQIDVVILLTKNQHADEYALAVETAWVYGPKNALTVVIGTDGETVSWARVVTLSRVEDLKIELRDELQGMQLTDPELIPTIRKHIEKQWHRVSMSEFEYLASHAKPHTGWLVFLYILAFASSITITYLAHHEDFFGERYWRH